MDKKFTGQYSGEKVLLFRKEYWFSFIKHTSGEFMLFLLFIGLIGIGIYYFVGIYISLLVCGFFLLVTIYYFLHEYNETYFIVTTRRIIKNASHGFLLSHRKELTIKNFSQIKSITNSLLERFMSYGNMQVNGIGEDDVIYFRGLKNHIEIGEYIGRITDYIRLNGHTDDIASFKTRKQRYN